MVRDRRYIVIGAGAVGCALGGLLHASGAEVVFVARGAQLDALATRGLSLSLPSRELKLDVEVVASVRDVVFTPRDVVLLCVKTQDAEPVLRDLAALAPREIPLVCAQNGVATEPLAARTFSRVLGLVVFSPMQFTSPGEVSIHAAPVLGGIEIGLHPQGADELVHAIVNDLVRADLDARAEPRILRWKYGKLLTNLGNALQALTRDAWSESPILALIRAEALRCYAAGGIEFAPLEEVYARYANVQSADVRGAARGGGSSWQSLARATGSIETDYLNGEIVRLGEAHGVATPMNRALASLARRAAEERWPPERLTMPELEAALGAS